MFGDFCGFTKLAEEMEPKTLIDLLNQYFCAFDKIVTSHNVEKLKTIGDAYMCASGLPAESRGHAIRMCLAALEIQHYLGVVLQITVRHLVVVVVDNLLYLKRGVGRFILEVIIQLPKIFHMNHLILGWM